VFALGRLRERRSVDWSNDLMLSLRFEAWRPGEFCEEIFSFLKSLNPERMTVLEAYVTGIPADGGGQLVVGAVVPRGDAALDADELRARLKRDLSAYKVPKQLWVCAKSDLPFLQSGKIKKQELARRIAERAAVE